MGDVTEQRGNVHLEESKVKITVVEQNGNEGYTQYIPASALSICSNFVRIILYKRSSVELNYFTILFLPGHGGRVLSCY